MPGPLKGGNGGEKGLAQHVRVREQKPANFLHPFLPASLPLCGPSSFLPPASHRACQPCSSSELPGTCV